MELAYANVQSHSGYETNAWIQRNWHRPTDGRYYRVQLQQDLFQSWILIKRWGKRHSRSDRSIEYPCESYEDGVCKIENIAKRRLQRGYRATLFSFLMVYLMSLLLSDKPGAVHILLLGEYQPLGG